MSVRPPKALQRAAEKDPVTAALDQEVLAEKVTTHGRLLRRLEAALAALEAFDAAAESDRTGPRIESGAVRSIETRQGGTPDQKSPRGVEGGTPDRDETRGEEGGTPDRDETRGEEAQSADREATRGAEAQSADREATRGAEAQGADRDETRAALVSAAGEALWYVVVQRDLCGFTNTSRFLADMKVPAEVRLRMGVVR